MAAAFERALDEFVDQSPFVVAVHDLATKWRLELTGTYTLDLHFNATSGRYSYVLVFEQRRIPAWDNAPHHHALTGFPHHLHRSDGTVESSDLNGDPGHDLPRIRKRIEAILRSLP